MTPTDRGERERHRRRRANMRRANMRRANVWLANELRAGELRANELRAGGRGKDRGCALDVRNALCWMSLPICRPVRYCALPSRPVRGGALLHVSGRFGPDRSESPRCGPQPVRMPAWTTARTTVRTTVRQACLGSGGTRRAAIVQPGRLHRCNDAAAAYNSGLMSIGRIAALWLLVVLAAAPGGCVWPGDVDPTVVGRYQRALAGRGPQGRGTGERGLLSPAKTQTVLPPLKIVKDAATGRTRVFLSLNAAIMRALASNTDIRIVSFDPAVSRQEMIQAAAEFDYVVNGNWSFGRTDEDTSSPYTSGPVRTRVYSVGLSKKTVTGAQAKLAWTLTQTLGMSTFTTLAEQWDQRVELDVTQPLLRGGWPEFNLAKLKVARLTYGTKMAAFRQKVEEVVSQVVTAYWTLIQARRDRTILQALLDRTVETRDRVDKRRAVDATDVELMQAQAAVESRRADLLRADKVVLDVQDQLLRLIGDRELNLTCDCRVVPTTRPNKERVRLDPADQLLTALQHSPVLDQARLAIEMTRISVAVAWNQLLPKLDFRATVTGQGIGANASQARRRMNTGQFVGYNLSLLYEYPIGNRERLANLRSQELAKMKAISSLQNAADMVALNVRERVRQVNTSYQEMQAEAAAVVAARNELDALEATEQLRQLSPEFLQVKLSAQERLANAQRQELAAMVAYNTAISDLARATGTTLEMHGVQLAMPVVLGDATTPAGPADNYAGGR